MSRNMIIGIVVVALIAIVGVGAFMAFKGKNNTGTGPTQSATPSSNSTMQGTIQSILGGGKNVACDITYTDGSGTGKIYVTGGKFRGDFSITVQGRATVMHMIQDGTYAYTWFDGQSTGTKISIAQSQKMMATSSAQTNGSKQGADLNAKVSMHCSGWAVDNSMLVVPTNVQFTDLSTMMKSGAGVPLGSGGASTATCNQITDPQVKAACLGAMSAH